MPHSMETTPGSVDSIAARRRERRAERARMRKLEVDVRQLKESNDFLVQTIENLAKDLEALLAVFKAAEGAFKVLSFLGTVLKPLIVIGTVVGSIYAAWTKFRS